MTIFSVLQAMIMTLHASLIENSSNHQINSQTKVNLRLKNGRLIHARFLIGGFKVTLLKLLRNGLTAMLSHLSSATAFLHY